jgi:hypothetical protein
VLCPEPFQPDFFNNVAAVASVLIFAKVVSHRSRNRETQRSELQPLRAFFHGLGVMAAVVAIGAALGATEAQADACILHGFAWGGLVVASMALIGEILIDDVWPHFRPQPPKSVKAPAPL